MTKTTEKDRQKEVEFECIDAVARAAGCQALPESESNQWPDGWLKHPGGKKEPVEVVAAFRRPANENPKAGSSWLRKWKHGYRAARALAEATGECA